MCNRNRNILNVLFGVCLSFGLTKLVFASEIIPAPEDDPHSTKVGFFDIHVCNWPDQPLFFLTLFSSYQYQDIAKVEIFTPQGSRIGELDFNKFRIIEKKGKPLKKAFIKHFDIPKGAGDGWYYTHVTMKDGKVYEAKDFVVLRKMERASNPVPKVGSENIALPEKLTWDKIPGAKYYRVFIEDAWEGTSILASDLLDKPELILPKDLLKAGGYYSWRIHARDVNENVLLGDFNHGSLTDPMTFSIADN